MSQVRVVLDTNIWVAAGFRKQSASARLLGQIRDNRIQLVWDKATRRETRFILTKIPPLSWSAVEPLFRDEGRFDGPTDPDQFAYIPDPDDRKFAALAAAAGVPLISSDRHLLTNQPRAPIPILTPQEFLDWQSLAG